jgi:hypothetical protein
MGVWPASTVFTHGLSPFVQQDEQEYVDTPLILKMNIQLAVGFTFFGLSWARSRLLHRASAILSGFFMHIILASSC